MPDSNTTPIPSLDLIAQAVLAPSSHNTQPWVFHVHANMIELLADRTRALPVNDPDDRELVISCGCALFNLRVAVAAARFEPRVTLEPEDGDRDWLARVELVDGGQIDESQAALSHGIAARRTYRKPFAPRDVAPDAVAALVEAAAQEGASLHVLESEEQRSALADLVAEGDAAQWANPSWRRELASWMHPRRRGEGLPVSGLASGITQFVVRTFDMGNGTAARDRELATGSPLLAVLTTEGDDQVDHLRAGQALERVLLTAVHHGLQASFLNQPVQVPALRHKLHNLEGVGGFPQIVMRLGYPLLELPPSPRRPVAAVIE